MGSVNDYNSDQGYWQVPKGRVVSRDNLPLFRQELEVVKTHFAGKTRWDFAAQVLFAEEMIDAGTYTPQPFTGDNEKAARARMEKVIFDLLGLAWVDENSVVVLTPVGEAFAAGGHAELLITRQVQKYQFSNPLDHQAPDFRIIPHSVLLKILLDLAPEPLTTDEFSLFGTRVRQESNLVQPHGTGLYRVAMRDQLSAYRGLTEDDRRELRQRLEEWDSPGLDNMWKRICGDQSYILGFVAFPRYLEHEGGMVSIRDLEAATAVSDFYGRAGAYIEFKAVGDWFAHYGEMTATPTVEQAYRYYEDVGDVSRAVEGYKVAKARGRADPARSPEDYELERVQEAELEEWLAANLDRLEDGLRLYSEQGKQGKQYETSDAGTVDLLCTSVTGLTVIELKRSKASDETFGQLSRYMGWVRRNLCPDGKVEGIIVADAIDQKLNYSLDCVPNLRDHIRAVSYSDLGLSFEDLGYDPDGFRRVQLTAL